MRGVSATPVGGRYGNTLTVVTNDRCCHGCAAAHTVSLGLCVPAVALATVRLAQVQRGALSWWLCRVRVRFRRDGATVGCVRLVRDACHAVRSTSWAVHGGWRRADGSSCAPSLFVVLPVEAYSLLDDLFFNMLLDDERCVFHASRNPIFQTPLHRARDYETRGFCDRLEFFRMKRSRPLQKRTCNA